MSSARVEGSFQVHDTCKLDRTPQLDTLYRVECVSTLRQRVRLSGRVVWIGSRVSRFTDDCGSIEFNPKAWDVLYLAEMQMWGLVSHRD